ncbi:MAG: hypothetical protein ACI9N1_000621 [Flavobacteriales bacterium]|jgi:hypothetical protein
MPAKNFFVLSIFIFLFFNCKKDKQPSFQIEVQTIDFNTELPVNDIKVNLSSKSLRGSIYSTSFRLINSQTSKLNGICNFNTEYSTIIEFKIETEAGNYQSYNLLINPDDILKDDANKTLIKLQSTASVNINIKNQFPLNSQDEIVFNSTTPNCPDCIQIPALVLSGMQMDTGFNGLILGNQYFKHS